MAGREGETEAQELRAWRFSFVALAASAVTGGAMALYWEALPFMLTALSLAVSVLICTRFREPNRRPNGVRQRREAVQFVALRAVLSTPLLRWLFALSVLMYVFSHVPFVFGQPFIQDALDNVGLDQNAPLDEWSGDDGDDGGVGGRIPVRQGASGSDGTGGGSSSWPLGSRLPLSGVLALTNAPIVIGILLLRMVPDAFSKPFIIARNEANPGPKGRGIWAYLHSRAASGGEWTQRDST